jgi:hypothetical protein
MSELVIYTDNKWKNFKYGYEVPKKVLKSQFDYLKDGEELDGFFKYRNYWYHLSDFMTTTIPKWDGAAGDSYFSGVLIKVSKDGEKYKAAHYIVKG